MIVKTRLPHRDYQKPKPSPEINSGRFFYINEDGKPGVAMKDLENVELHRLKDLGYSTRWAFRAIKAYPGDIRMQLSLLARWDANEVLKKYGKNHVSNEESAAAKALKELEKHHKGSYLKLS